MNWEITKQVFAAIIRWALAYVGVKLVEKGIIDKPTADAWINEMTAAILGFIILSVPVIWKILNSRFQILSLIKAVQTDPPADTKAEIKAAVADVKAEVKAENSAVLSA